jgi:hypothetical protein
MEPVYMYSEPLTFEEMIAVFQKVTGRKMRYEQLPYGELARQSPILGDAFQKMYDYLCNDDTRSGGGAYTSPDEVSDHAW